MSRPRKQQASPWRRWRRWRQRRRLAREARGLAKEARRILRRQGYRVRDEVAARVRDAAAALDEARRGGGIEAMRTHLERLDGLLDRHLSFGRKSAVREYTESIGVAVIIALLLRAFVVEAFKIPSGSMIPTLKVGDHIFVNKFIYGIRIPFTNYKPRFMEGEPKRGEVIVFVYPVDETKDFIKRVVAVGGDTIEVRNEVVYVNGEAVPRRRLPGPCTYADVEEESGRWQPRACVAFEERVGDITYRVIQDAGLSNLNDMPPVKVPPRHVFVMGDNRDNSHDSRRWGPVPDDNIKGKAMIIWWSRGVPEGIRWRRFFHLVHSRDDTPLALPVAAGP